MRRERCALQARGFAVGLLCVPELYACKRVGHQQTLCRLAAVSLPVASPLRRPANRENKVAGERRSSSNSVDGRHLTTGQELLPRPRHVIVQRSLVATYNARVNGAHEHPSPVVEASGKLRLWISRFSAEKGAWRLAADCNTFRVK